MNCGTCKYWVHTGDRVSAGDDWHYTSRLGKCLNPIVQDLVFPTIAVEILILKHQNEFDESFGCIFQEPNTDGTIQ
ncbi:MAG TPA: hypothetical protein V6C58_02905, partial [Allocoleopsis sp.]